MLSCPFWKLDGVGFFSCSLLVSPSVGSFLPVCGISSLWDTGISTRKTLKKMISFLAWPQLKVSPPVFFSPLKPCTQSVMAEELPLRNVQKPSFLWWFRAFLELSFKPVWLELYLQRYKYVMVTKKLSLWKPKLSWISYGRNHFHICLSIRKI